jgi:hypothetical protein
VVLLALLVLNLVHSHSHFGRVVGHSAFNPSTTVSTSKEGREAGDDKLQPCLACSCQKHAKVVLASFYLLPELLRVSHQVLEYQQTFISQSSFNPVLSRAPPVAG